MRITLSPKRAYGTLSLSRKGDVLTINNQPFDFSGLPDGGELPIEAVASEAVIRPVKRVNGEIEITLLLPLGPNPTPAQAFLADIIDPPDGAIALP